MHNPFTAGRRRRSLRRAHARGSAAAECPMPSRLIAETRARVDRDGLELDSGQIEVLERIAGMPCLPQGIYLHGDVGRGKSWLADIIVDQFPEPKRRLHCHELLAGINAAIAQRTRAFAVPGAESGSRDMTVSTADYIASVVDGYDFVMLDDFHVHDVADGELLLIVLRELRSRGTFTLLTSNYSPDQLMPNPLFHQSFQPAIDLIEDMCTVIGIAAGRDHRQSTGHDRGFASGAWTVVGTWKGWRAGAGEKTDSPLGKGDVGSLEVRDEPRVARVSFAEICERPYSAADYFSLVAKIEHLEVFAVPHPARIDEEAFQRFAYLIDALVDQDVRVDIESAASRREFAAAKNLPRDADRMLSRLSLLRSAIGAEAVLDREAQSSSVQRLSR